MKRFFIWQYMLNKRLLHKKEFLILLCLIPLLVWGITLVSKEESSVVTVALSMEDEEDKLANQIIEEMMQEDSIIRFESMDVEASYNAVRAGEADCAWIFREDFQVSGEGISKVMGSTCELTNVTAKKENELFIVSANLSLSVLIKDASGSISNINKILDVKYERKADAEINRCFFSVSLSVETSSIGDKKFL